MSGPKFNFRFAINCEENVEADATFDDFDESEDSQEQSTASTSTSNDNGSTA